VLAVCALPLYGQTANTGAIAGTVSDPSGALVPRAAVVVNSQGAGEKSDIAKDAEGNFSAQFLTPGIVNRERMASSRRYRECKKGFQRKQY
jgi:hypothetical protein